MSVQLRQSVGRLSDDDLRRLQQGDVVVEELERRRERRERRRRQQEAQERQQQVEEWVRSLSPARLDQLADDPRSGLTESQRIASWEAAEPAFEAGLSKTEVVEAAGQERRRRRQARADGGPRGRQVVAGVDGSTATLALLVAGAWVLFGGG